MWSNPLLSAFLCGNSILILIFLLNMRFTKQLSMRKFNVLMFTETNKCLYYTLNGCILPSEHAEQAGI
jgi:hypothetical protein